MNKLIFAFLFSCANVLRAAQTFDPGAEFSITENPHGVWSYGYSSTLGGNVILFKNTLPFNATGSLGVGLDTWYLSNNGAGDPLIAHNPLLASFTNINATVESGAVSLHPGPNKEYSVLRFTAPQDGSYRIVASFFGQTTAPTSTDVHILVDGQPVFDGIVQGFGAASSQGLSITRQIASGGTVDFAVGVGQNGNYASDLTGLNLNITQLAGVDDAKSDFSTTSNPSGAWGYGYSASLGSPFISFNSPIKRGTLDYWINSSFGSDPGLGHNPDKALQLLNEIVFQPHEMILHPGPSGRCAILRWTAPAAGFFLLQSTFIGEGASSTVDVHILQKGQPIFADLINGRGKRSTYSSIITAVAGDTLDFAVAYGSDHTYDSDTTGIDVQIRQIQQAPSVNFAIRPAVELSWPKQNGNIYQVQSAATINATIWQNIGAPFADTASPTNLFQINTNPAQFYRLITFH